MTDTQHDERRRHQRFDLEYTIQIIGGEGDIVITAQTSNVSDGGLSTPLPEECAPDCGQEVQINLTVRRNKTGKVDMYSGLGEIIRHSNQDKDGVAEIALKFNAPMNLKLAEEASHPPPPVGI